MLASYLIYPFLGSMLIAVLTGLLSPIVIMRRASFTCHILGHTSMTGYLIAGLLGFDQLVGQLVVNMLFVVIILCTNLNAEETRIGVISNLCLGMGIYLLYQYQQGNAGSAMAVFYGSIFTINQAQVCLLLVLAVLTVLFCEHALKWYLFMLLEPVASLKYVHAPRFQIDLLFHLLLAAMVTMTCQLVGSLLVFTLLVGPGAIAMQWQGTFRGIFLVSMLTSLGTIVSALLCSCYLLPAVPVNVYATVIISLVYGIGEWRNLKKR